MEARIVQQCVTDWNSLRSLALESSPPLDLRSGPPSGFPSLERCRSGHLLCDDPLPGVLSSHSLACSPRAPIQTTLYLPVFINQRKKEKLEVPCLLFKNPLFDPRNLGGKTNLGIGYLKSLPNVVVVSSIYV